jgi:hypothetical protein
MCRDSDIGPPEYEVGSQYHDVQSYVSVYGCQNGTGRIKEKQTHKL